MVVWHKESNFPEYERNNSKRPCPGKNSLLSGGKLSGAGYVSICDGIDVNVYYGRTVKINVSE